MKQVAHECDDDAEILARCISDLMSESPGDDRFRLFDAIALHAEASFGGGLHGMLKEGTLSDVVARELLGNPAAPILLAYFVNSLVAYNALNGELDSSTADLFGDAVLPEFNEFKAGSTADKHGLLAKSFGLVGKRGEAYAPVGQRLRVEMFFRGALAAAAAGEHAKAEDSAADAMNSARKSALNRLFEHLHGVPYVYDDDTHKSRMKALRKRMAHIQEP